MFFFKSNEDVWAVEGITPLAGSSMSLRSLINTITAQEKPYSMGGLLFVLVLTLHFWAGIWLLQPSVPLTKAQPMIMEVSLVAAPSQQAAAAPVMEPKPLEPKKEEIKKPVKKKKSIKKKRVEPPKPKAIAEEAVAKPSEAEFMPAPVAPATAVRSDKPTTDIAPFTEANFNANYGINPKPKYPGIATSRGWQGTVRLLVKVSALGDSEEVTVQRSSGYEVLDEAAIEAVEKWKFIPAKRGSTPVASTVVVPINFVLNN